MEQERKRKGQLGWFQTECNVIKNKRWSQTTNQDWFIVGQSYYCYISLLLLSYYYWCIIKIIIIIMIIIIIYIILYIIVITMIIINYYY